MAVAALIRNGHPLAYSYGFNFFLNCIDELNGKEPEPSDPFAAQDKVLEELGYGK